MPAAPDTPSNLFDTDPESGKAAAPGRERVLHRGRAHSYAQLCEVWALSDHWPLEDGIRLLRKLPPRRLDQRPLESCRDDWLEILIELARNCVGDSLPVLDAAVPPEQLRVRPAALLQWAEIKGIPVPEELAGAVGRAEVKTEERLPPPQVRPTEIRRERCRTLAQLLWSQQPELSADAMARRPELVAIGCDRKPYPPSTLRQWIADLCPTGEE